MGFKAGDIVRLVEDRTFDGQLFQAGTLGTVAGDLASMQASLVLLGHDATTRLLSNVVLQLVVSATTLIGKSKTGSALRFGHGDRVKLRAARSYGGITYPAGCPGTVRELFPTLVAYLVDFDTDATDRLVPDLNLDPE